VSRSWGQLLGDADTADETADEQAGFFSRLRDSLGKTRRAMTDQLAAAAFDPADDEAWERLEEALIAADVGVPTTAELVQRLEAKQEVGELGEALAIEAAELLGDPAPFDLHEQPSVILVVGVNGTGKTTTIGKLASVLRDHDRSVILAAADTFRAAAEEQLEIWAERAGADFVGSERGGDPAAVAYDAIEAAAARGRDVVIVDTAGRLHTQTNLMEELRKVGRVIERRLGRPPDETLLVIDATTGQNGLQQARLFGQAVEVTAVALTKLDGSAKGGVALAIAHELGLPVKLVGVGEKIEDLRPFDPQDFARALLASSYRSTSNAMSTVVRYSLMRSFSTTALIDVTCAPWMPRTVFAAS
jgi:fused signal recognition particle receptor